MIALSWRSQDKDYLTRIYGKSQIIKKREPVERHDLLEREVEGMS